MVAGHGELGLLFADDEISESVGERKFITKPEAVVIKPEPDDHAVAAGGLAERDGHFIVTVADFGPLAPYGSPGLVEVAAIDAGLFEPVAKRHRSVGFLFADFSPEYDFGAFAAQVEPQTAGQDYRAPLVIEGVNGFALTGQFELHAEIAVGRKERLLCRGSRTEKQCGDT